MGSGSRIRFNQEHRLEQYFAAREASGFGEPWEKMVIVLTRGGELMPCRKCGGRRRKLRNGEWSEKGGCGWVTRRGKAPPAHRSIWKVLADRHDGIVPELREMMCPACEGRGWVQRKRKRRVRVRDITAWPTGSSKRGAGPNTAVVLADPSGEVTRWIAEMVEAELDLGRPPRVPSLVIVETYFTSDRSKVALWPLTAAGTTLLRQCPDELGELHPVQWLDNERTAASEQEGHRNRALVEAAELQALELLEQSAYAWNQVCPSEREQLDAETERAAGLEQAPPAAVGWR